MATYQEPLYGEIIFHDGSEDEKVYVLPLLHVIQIRKWLDGVIKKIEDEKGLKNAKIKG